MPSHGQISSASSSSSAQQHAQHLPPGAASGILQAAHGLGSIGAPSGNLKAAASGNSGTTTAGTDSLYYSGASMTTANTGGHASPTSNYMPQSNLSISTSASTSASTTQAEENPRRPPAYHRKSDELHLFNLGGTAQRPQGSPRDYTSSGPPRISLEQATPESSHYQRGREMPGSLQPGGSNRPSAVTTNTAPNLSTMGQSIPQDPYSTPSRSNPSSALTHGYSRSSPSTGYDGQSYIPFSTTPGGTEQYPSPTNQKYTPVNQRHVSNTPLGLADIRPRADSTMSDSPATANPYSYDGASAVPTNSNYLAPWALYAFDWCKWPAQNNDAGKVAVGSYLEDGHNFIQILESQITPTSPSSYTPSAPKYGIDFVKIAEATHSYPVTRLLWEPPSSQKQSTDLLATSGDHLRLWSLPSDTPMHNPSNSLSRPRDTIPSKLTPLALLSNSKTPEHTAPLTSLDWNTVSPSLIITSSIDTTCTIWDIPTLTAKTQLIAHDKEVFDVRFCANSTDVFVSCGADGSVRMFDLRSLEHSTIIYEPTAKDDKDPNSAGGRISPTLAQQTMSYAPPLLRLAASPHDTHLLATFSQDSKIIRILDVRQPGQALLELHGHAAAINCIEWSTSRRGTLASGADDSLVLVWDLLSQSNTVVPPTQAVNGTTAAQDNIRGPCASWRCDYEVGNISWAPHSGLSNDGGEWLGVSGGRGIWGVKF